MVKVFFAETFQISFCSPTSWVKMTPQEFYGNKHTYTHNLTQHVRPYAGFLLSINDSCCHIETVGGTQRNFMLYVYVFI